MAGAIAWCIRNVYSLHGWSSGVPTAATAQNGWMARKTTWDCRGGQPDPAGRANMTAKWNALINSGIYIYNPTPNTAVSQIWLRLDETQYNPLWVYDIKFYQLGDPDAGDPGGGTLYIAGYARLKAQAKSTGFYGNAIATTDTVTSGSWNTATLTGGQDTVGEIIDGETVTIGPITYTFKDTMATAYDVQISPTDAINTVNNLILAINGSGTPGTHYFAGTTAHAQVTAAAGDITGTIVLTSLLVGDLGNATVTTETMAEGAFDDVTLLGGVTPTYLAFPGFSFSSISSAVDSGAQGYTLTTSEDNVDLLLPGLKTGIWERSQCLLREVSWALPDDGYITFFGGEIGPVRYTSNRDVSIDVQGLFTRARQWEAESWSPTCRADLGDHRCSFPIADLKAAFTVSTVNSQLQFRSTTLTEADEYWTLGLVYMLTGNNAGYAVEVEKSTSTGGIILLMQQLPFDIQVGDTGEIYPGCNKNFTTCANTYNNTVNFQGEPFWPTSKGIVVG